MTVQLQCDNGHEWKHDESAGTVPTCPLCGSRVANESTPASSDTVDVLDQTYIVSPDAGSSRVDESKLSDSVSDAGTNAQSADVPDIELPGYEILSELGQGAMGVVYKARQQRLNRIVALKMLVTAGHDASLARAQTESESVAQLQHPGIVQIFDVQEHNNALFFAFEFVDGGALKPDDVATPRRAAELIEAIARGVHYAHTQGVVHRDLKPDNILMTADGIPKVADFGLAKQMQSDVGQTQAGSIMGTPHYMSPEQAAGETERIGPSTDIYSLGCILYRLLTGQTTFDDGNVVHLLEQVRDRVPTPPRKIAPKVHADLETICLKCLEKQPVARYESAGELADDLRRFLDGEPILAKPVGPIVRGLRWIRKRAIAVSAASALLLVTSIATLLALSSARDAEAEMAARAPVNIERPAGLPSFSVPSDNPVTQGKVELGKQLFFDRRLSADNSIACVSCHDPKSGWADPRQASTGIQQQKGSRNSPPVANTAYLHFLFWDGRVTSLEEQAVKPITNPIEMGVESLDDLSAKLRAIEGYRIQFDRVFDDGVTPKNIGAALTAFERTLVAGNAPFDRAQAGDRSALSPSATRGMEIFFNEGHCSACHSGELLTDGGFHNIGVGQDKEPVDDGRFAVTGREGDRGSFKTPSLRDIARTAPYMHDGSMQTLEEVVKFYVHGGMPNPNLDEEIFELELTADQQQDLVEFLQIGLTSDQYPRVDPPELPQ